MLQGFFGLVKTMELDNGAGSYCVNILSRMLNYKSSKKSNGEFYSVAYQKDCL